MKLLRLILKYSSTLLSCCKFINKMDLMHSLNIHMDACFTVAFTFGGELADSLWLASSLRGRERKRREGEERKKCEMTGRKGKNRVDVRDKEGERNKVTNSNSSRMQFSASSTRGRQKALHKHLLQVNLQRNVSKHARDDMNTMLESHMSQRHKMGLNPRAAGT